MNFINTLFIFGAEKLFILAPIIGLWIFYKSSPEMKREIVIFAFFSLPLTFILAGIARELYFNPRPFVVGGFEPLIPHAPDNGFPSDHTLLVAAVASILTFFHKRSALVVWLVAVVVAVSRIYVGVHHLSDVLASIALAIVSAAVVHAILEWGRRVDNKFKV